MRAIFLLLLPLFVAGCGENGSTRTEAIATYEAEIRELARIEDQMRETENKRTESLMLLGENASAESQANFNSIYDREIKDLTPALEAQKLRVEAARKAKDAAE